MAKTTATSELSRVIKNLQVHRKEHEKAIVDIDAIFDEYGIRPEKTRRRRKPGRPKGSTAKKRVKKKGRTRIAKKRGY